MNNIDAQIKSILSNAQKHVNGVAAQGAQDAMREIIDVALSELDGFHDVTGNLRNSLAVAVFHDGVLKGFYSSAQALNHAPTRVTLKQGERYNLDYYWGGEEVDSIGKPYRAPAGDRNYLAPQEAQEFFTNKIPSQRGWCYVIVSAVDYAKYLEARDGVNILTQLHDDFEQRGAKVSEMKYE